MGAHLTAYAVRDRTTILGTNRAFDNAVSILIFWYGSYWIILKVLVLVLVLNIVVS
jgi:hypothetical protein